MPKPKKSLYDLPKIDLFSRTSPDKQFCTFKFGFQKCHKLVNCSMLWQRIRVRPIATILFFRVFDKTGNFSVVIFCEAPVTANQYISKQK